MDKFEEEHKEEEHAKQRRREARLYANIEVADLKALKAYPQTPDFDVFDFDMDPPLHAGFRIKKDTTINELKSILEEYYNVPADLQRLWKWDTRENETYRIYRPISNNTSMLNGIC